MRLILFTYSLYYISVIQHIIFNLFNILNFNYSIYLIKLLNILYVNYAIFYILLIHYFIFNNPTYYMQLL